MTFFKGEHKTQFFIHKAKMFFVIYENIKKETPGSQPCLKEYRKMIAVSLSKQSRIGNVVKPM